MAYNILAGATARAIWRPCQAPWPSGGLRVGELPRRPVGDPV
jgi:hypothetical protein